MPRFVNLVFEGGGVKGIAYYGALNELEKAGVLGKVKRVGGTSAGAIFALLLGLNYSLDEIKGMLSIMDFRSFQDDSWGVARDLTRLLTEYGYYKGAAFLRWAEGLVEKKTGNKHATFNDIQNMKKTKGFRDLYFVATNLSRGCAEIFSHEHTPDMPLAYAVRASMSIPVFFTAFSYNNDIYVDGGLINNYPIRLFDKVKYLDKPTNGIKTVYYEKENQTQTENLDHHIFNAETLGFRLEDKDKIDVLQGRAKPQVSQHVTDFTSYLWALVETGINCQQDNTHIESQDWERTVYINSLGIKTTEFDLSDAKKTALIESGSQGVKIFFEELQKRDLKADVKAELLRTASIVTESDGAPLTFFHSPAMAAAAAAAVATPSSLSTSPHPTSNTP